MVDILLFYNYLSNVGKLYKIYTPNQDSYFCRAIYLHVVQTLKKVVYRLMYVIFQNQYRHNLTLYIIDETLLDKSMCLKKLHRV